MLEIENLTKTFGSEVAVDDISFDVPDGKIVALLGPSGCGKTTTLRCVAGVESPDTGQIVIDNNVVSSDDISVSPENRELGMVFQNYAVWPHKSVYENVVFSLKHTATNIDKDNYRDRVMEVLELVEIEEFWDTPATDLSGGQQQRTALARAIVHDPSVLLMDEPLSNLDRELRTRMRYELQKLQNELGISMLYVTHDQEEAFYLADKVVILRDGNFIEAGTPTELYNRPRKPFTRQFVGQWNQITGQVNQDKIETPIGEFDLDTVDRQPETSQFSSGYVSCFIRPTDIDLGEHVKNGHIELNGSIVAEGVLGELYEITIAIDGADQELIVQTDDHMNIERGSPVSLNFSPANLKVYSAIE